MPFQRLPAAARVMAAAGLVLTVAGCSGQVTPLGPDAPPQPSPLRTPIVLQAMTVRSATPAGGCPAGYVVLSAPGQGNGGQCYRDLGTPVTFTSAVVAQAATTSGAGQGPAAGSPSGVLISVPAADQAALTAVTTTAYQAKGAVEISVAGQVWGLPMAFAPVTHGQFEIALPYSKAVQLQHLLVP